jgi:hypothetical protein
VRIQTSAGKLTAWQRIFLQSKANGAPYNGDALERYKWDWPKGTYFQRRLYQTKFLNSAELRKGAHPRQSEVR